MRDLARHLLKLAPCDAKVGSEAQLLGDDLGGVGRRMCLGFLGFCEKFPHSLDGALVLESTWAVVALGKA